ncbi:protein kinase [Nonomuraea sp. NPDC046570]|uniref:WD40 repeat domain-containing serine/threonine protein kinase n=1 Tax=Nonomuraea sp. NPDC046570 TaxID=3155255 RepID=UPI0033DC9309
MPDTHPLQPGDPAQLGIYRLLGRLGKGAQGVVFKGQGPDGETVAIKLLNTRLDKPGIDAERFLREVAAARRVAQFCTAQVLDANMDGDLPYIVSELVEGVSLQRIVQTDGPRTGGALYRLAVGTVTALAAIHRAGIVHRDFKPSNVLLGPDGPRVIDFGIARALDSAMTISSGVVGTPAYMSPEQISGERVAPASDMFSWALTMTFAATGRPAFGQDSLPAVIYRVMNEEPDLSALPDNLRAIVQAGLSKRAEERPSAAETLFALLENQGAIQPGDAEVALTTGTQVAAEQPSLPPPTPFLLPDPQPPHPAASNPGPPHPGASTAGSPQPHDSHPNSFHPNSSHPNSSHPHAAPPQLPHQQGTPPHGTPQQGSPQEQQAEPPAAASGWANPSGMHSIPPQPYTPQQPPPPYGQPPQGPVYGQPYGQPPGPYGQPAQPYGKGQGSGGQDGQQASYPPGPFPPRKANDNDAFFRETAPEEKRAEDRARRKKAGIVGGAMLAALVLAATVLFVAPSAFDDDPRPGPTNVAIDTSNGPPTNSPPSSGPPTTEPTGQPSPSPSTPVTTPDANTVPTLPDLIPLLGKQDGKALKGHSKAVQSLTAIKIGGALRVISGSQDGTLRIWDPVKHRTVGRLRGHDDEVYAVASATIGGKPMAVSGGYDHTVRVWNLKTRKGKVLGYHPIAVFAVAVGRANGKWVAVTGDGDGTLRVWDLKKNRQLGSIRAHRKDINWLGIGTVGDRPVVVSASEDKTLRVWDLNKRKAYGKAYKGHRGAVFSVAVGEVDGKPVVASGGKDKRIRLWNPKTGASYGGPLKGHTDNVYSLSFGTVDGKRVLVSGGTDGTIRLWDAEMRKSLGKPVKAHKGGVYSVSVVTVDGRPAVVSAGKDKLIRIWRFGSATNS